MTNKLLLSVALLLALSSCNDKSAKADNDFDVSVNDPQLMNLKPRVLFDEAHNNHHKIETTFQPFATLLRNDGCIVNATVKPVDKATLTNTNIFIIATAAGKEDPGDKSPFLESEIELTEEWVRNGGSLLLIAEHFPFGLAMAPLLNKFGVQVHNGYTEDTLLINKEVKDALLFTKATGNLNPAHPILNKIERLNTFTGSSVKGDSTWTHLLIFTPHAQNYNVNVTVNKNGSDIITSVEYADFYPAKEYSQGVSRQYGKGKIVVLAEVAFLTAQVDKNGNKFGMNVPNQDNKQFVLNLIRWLAEK